MPRCAIDGDAHASDVRVTSHWRAVRFEAWRPVLNWTVVSRTLFMQGVEMTPPLLSRLSPLSLFLSSPLHVGSSTLNSRRCSSATDERQRLDSSSQINAHRSTTGRWFYFTAGTRLRQKQAPLLADLFVPSIRRFPACV